MDEAPKFECPDCGSTAITTDYTQRGSTASNLHQMHEISIEVFGGCDECSCSVWTMRIDQYFAWVERITPRQITSNMMLDAEAVLVGGSPDE